MRIKASMPKIIYSVFVILSLLCSLPAYGANDLNQQIETLSKKLASAAQGDVLEGGVAQVYIGLGQRQGILPGNKFEIVRQGEPLKVGDEIIGYKETPVAEVEVERVREKISICKIINKTDTPQQGDKAYQLRKKINTLVIGQFSYNQGFNRLTKSLQEKLVTTMANRGMKVVERDQLERVLKEQKLGYSGLVNMSSAKKIGELLGAEGLLLGTINDMGDVITLNARLVDIESGKAVSASEVELHKTPLIAQLLNIPIEVEKEPYISQPTSPPAAPGLQIQHFDKYIQNQFLRVEPKGVHKSEDMKRIAVTLLVTNISQKSIYLAISGPTNSPKVTLDTYQGEVLYAKDVGGFPVVHPGNAHDLKQYAPLGEGGQVIFMASFVSKDPIKSNVFSISGMMFNHSGESQKFSRFSIGLPNIKIN